MRNKSRVLREGGAEEGNIEIGGTGFPRKPKRANLCERLLFRKHHMTANGLVTSMASNPKMHGRSHSGFSAWLWGRLEIVDVWGPGGP